VSATRSLRSRLAWSASAVVALWLAVLTVGANVVLGSALSRQADTLLRARAEATAATVELRPGGGIGVAEGQDDAALDLGTWIFTADGAVVETPAGRSSALDATAAVLARRGSGTIDTGVAERIRLLAQPVVLGGRHVATVVTSTALAPYDQLRRTAWISSAGLAAALLLAVHLVLRANVGRALRPVQEMTAQADRWSTGDVDRRFGDVPRPAELDSLAATLDTVLERLAAVLRRERDLTDELGHELRTPLARIRGEIDLLRDRPRTPEELAAAHAAIDDAVGTMQRTIDTLVTTARQDPGTFTGRSSVGPVLEALGRRVTARRDDVRFTVRADPRTTVGLEPQLLERLLSPLLENAARYAHERIDVSAEVAGGRVRLVVADDGPGIAPADAERVFRPGWRADAADGHEGSGLGLPLARRLATSAGGGIRVDPTGPGARFVVDLPPA
jgi:signal transduction histidine kinase